MVLDPGTARERSLGRVASLRLGRGQSVAVISASGGGFGDPLERALVLVERDVRRGLVSKARAEAVYGAVFGPDGCIDAEASRKRRAALGRDHTTRGLFDLGPERARHDTVWPPEVRSLLAAETLRFDRGTRRRAFGHVLERVAEGGTPASPELVARLLAEIG